MRTDVHASSTLPENVRALKAGEGSDEVSLLKASVPLGELVSVNRQQVDIHHRDSSRRLSPETLHACRPSRSALVITDTDDRLIARAAMSGLKSQPISG
jgi:hypothetical protein